VPSRSSRTDAPFNESGQSCGGHRSWPSSGLFKRGRIRAYLSACNQSGPSWSSAPAACARACCPLAPANAVARKKAGGQRISPVDRRRMQRFESSTVYDERERGFICGTTGTGRLPGSWPRNEDKRLHRPAYRIGNFFRGSRQGRGSRGRLLDGREGRHGGQIDEVVRSLSVWLASCRARPGRMASQPGARSVVSPEFCPWIEKWLENRSMFVKTEETGPDWFHRFWKIGRSNFKKLKFLKFLK
jgi:hypothetical protein